MYTRLGQIKFGLSPLLSMFLVFFAMMSALPLIVQGSENQSLPAGYTGIYSAADMEKMRVNPDGKYLLMKDIDLAGESTAAGGWRPIGNERIPFTGVFDGNGHTITGMKIHVKSENTIYTGLFGYTVKAELQNVRIVESSVEAITTGSEADVRAGGLAGHAVSTRIHHVVYSGSVKAVSPFAAHAGGIVGSMDGKGGYVGDSRNVATVVAEADSPIAGGISASLNLVEAYQNVNKGNVTAQYNGTAGNPHGEAAGITASAENTSISKNGNFGNIMSSEYAGGLVGFVTQTSVRYSFNAASVSGTSYTGGIGAFVANNASIEQSYNTGSIVSDLAGGLLGYFGGDTIKPASLYSSFNTGDVNDGSSGGGLVHTTGYRTTIEASYNAGKSKHGLVANAQYPVTIQNCYHNNATSVVGEGKWNGNENVRYLDADAMKKAESFQDFSFDYAWTMGGNPSYPYPELRSNPVVDSGEIQSVTIGNHPRTTYVQGAPFDPAYGTLNVKHADGTEISVPITNEMVTTFDSSKSGQQVAIITYNDWKVDVSVDVKEWFLITFVDYDGTELKTERATFGKTVTPPAVAERQGYRFTGWSGDYANPVDDLTIYAQYDRIHTVVFKAEDGAIIDTRVVKDGESITPPPLPQKEGYDAEWADFYNPIHSDMVVIASYWKKTYEVVFKDKTWGIISKQYVQHGEAATPPTNNITVPAGYYLDGWDQDISNVSSNMIVYPKFERQEFTITYQDYDGTILGTEIVKYGSPAIAPVTLPVREGYEFIEWDPAYLLERVYYHGTLTAQYQLKTYQVTFLQDGKKIETQTVEHGKSATPPSVNMTGKTGFRFTGWDQDTSSVKSDMTVNAKFALKQYSVTFKSDSGKTISSQKIDHGKYAVLPKAPVKTGYSFIGWFQYSTDNLPFQVKNAITENKVLYARFAKNTAVPTSVKATSAGYTAAKVSWGKVSGAQYYQVYRATSKTGTYSYVATASGSASSYTNTRLTTGRTYYYKVRAYRNVNSTRVYSPYSAVVSAKPVLAAPTGVKASRVSTTSTKVSWGKVTEASGYEVLRATSSKGSYTKMATVSSSTLSYTNKRLTKGKTYYYKVRAYKTVSGKKIYSGYSSYVYRKAI
ncbi:fibronectin type III domain-containing protein [Neobacillus mesonae]|uniref:fibronectin type III domain-containing protein n=1 Tax=Neobacillus mesonae TaxID=1193713 RepID=UPI0008353642|nr:InlB B-repeat-containing protein [Neobacillus mesonae]